MKRIVTILLLMFATHLMGQQYNNEWINFNQTYYKFKVGSSGLYRLPQSVLAGAGLSTAPVQNLQLWRNGQQVPFYSTVASGPLGASDYLEFWAEANDGKPDKVLYRDPAYQHVDKYSLETDTAVFFLTLATTPNTNIITQGTNNVAANTLPVEPYFWHTEGTYYKVKLNPGFAAVVGEYVYSSSYDKGEFWATDAIYSDGRFLLDQKTNLYVYPGGPDAKLKFGAAGIVLMSRRVKARVNGTQLLDTAMDYFNDMVATVDVPLALISGGSADIVYQGTAAIGSDRMVVSHSELIYPRQFNFGGQKNFKFQLPAKSQGYYLEINNFNYTTVAPVLYDLTSLQRYTADISVPGVLRFAIPGSTAPTDFVLVNEEAGNITNVSSLTTKNFINFNDPSLQGDYIIISNPLLYNGTNGRNPVDDYKNYRRSANGGGFNAKVYDINELVDQFAFGIKKHPLSVKNFLKFARNTFATTPKFVLLIGHGVAYPDYRKNESSPLADQLNLVPSFGYPASDNKLCNDDAVNSIAVTPIGRLSVVIPKELEDYLDKVIEYETMQRTASQTLSGRDWMKNVMHVTGASDPYLGTVLCNYMHSYKELLEDTMTGAKITTFCKTSANPVDLAPSENIAKLFEEGISIITYFGHSSSSTLEFNLDNPQNYNNPGKYPVFFVNGCNAGNFFVFDPQRFTFNETLSEKFTLAKQRGGISFVASTHFGIVNYLNIYISSLYIMIGKEDYGKTLGEINRDALQRMITITGVDDYYARTHAEQITIHGDPALRLNFEPKPDYVVEEPQINISPTFISVADSSFNLKVKVINIGKSVNDSVTFEVKRQYPDGSVGVIWKNKIPGIRYSDSLVLAVPIVATRDKGLNRIIVTIDGENIIAESSESNNTASRDVYIYEDEARPVYPYNYAIVNDAAQNLYASTANPLSNIKQYVMEMDTTAAFNSTMKVSKTITSPGGILQFIPGVPLVDSMVYYWRVSVVPGSNEPFHWNMFSFRYIAGSVTGFNQSHYFQHTESNLDRISLDSNSRQYGFGERNNTLFIRHGSWVTSVVQEADLSVSVNGSEDNHNTCAFSSIVFNVFDPITMKPWVNVTDPVTGQGLYGSWRNDCFGGRKYNFEFRHTDTASRRKMMDFMDNVIPNGYYVVVRSFLLDSTVYPAFPRAFVDDWKADTAYFGSNNSIYHRFMQYGFTGVDSFNRQRQFVFFYKKNQNNIVPPKFDFTYNTFDKIVFTVDCPTPDTVGVITSPKFGPSKKWHDVIWNGRSLENPSNDNVTVDVIGVDLNNTESVIYTLDQTQQNFDISSIDATQYPYVRLRMRAVDSVTLSPYQLKSWQVTFDPVPEGAVAPNLFFVSRDTMEIGEKFNFGVAFKNISQASFDSLKVKIYVLDHNNRINYIDLPRAKPLISGDTVKLLYQIDSKDFPGQNVMYLEVNPDNDQVEHYHYNNFVFRDFYVRPDLKNPLLDVTFDGMHILNRDIVSPKPHIQVKLKDEAKYMLLNDTSLVSVQVRYPDQLRTLKTFNFDSDTLRFIPAANGTDNTATIEFGPYFPEILDQNGSPLNPDGDEYELIIKGKDRSGNKAGNLEYRVTFKVINKPMISNLLNYPNPFTTSTAFVFTLTGSEIPQNMKIQILTVTGKIVREITKDELGPIHIGRNITEYKWDGTDQFGQKLANGVYLYRFVTSLNGKSLDKYKANGDNTDKFFNNGYGKMYLMR
jgi:hypothetical protein